MLFLKSLPFWWSWRWGCSPLCHPPCLQCLPFGLMPSRSLHFVYILSMLRASTWHELPCWVKKWCWCALPTRMNCYKSNSVPSVFAILCSHTQQALLHWAATWTTSQSSSSILSGFAKFLKDQVLVCFQQRNVISVFTNTKIMGLLQNTAHFHCRAWVPWTLNR